MLIVVVEMEAPGLEGLPNRTQHEARAVGVVDRVFVVDLAALASEMSLDDFEVKRRRGILVVCTLKEPFTFLIHGKLDCRL